MKTRAFIPALIALFMTLPSLKAQDYKVIPDEMPLQIKTPSLHDVKVLKMQLPNGLQAYLISDPNTPKSAAAMSVEVGFWEDPAQNPGMAHFCEHMLFLGTEKYPDEGSFQRYVIEHGGYTNAYTSFIKTVYEFDVDNTSFDASLDRFAQFFIHPLFNESGVDREKHAVDQEFSYRTHKDTDRAFMVAMALGNPQHPFSRFGCGNLETLNAINRDQLIQWYNTHYSANIMHLVLYSNQSLDSLSSLVLEYFSESGGIGRHATLRG